MGFPPKSSIVIGFSIINHPFWETPIFGNTHMTRSFLLETQPAILRFSRQIDGSSLSHPAPVFSLLVSALIAIISSVLYILKGKIGEPSAFHSLQGSLIFAGKNRSDIIIDTPRKLTWSLEREILLRKSSVLGSRSTRIF